MDLFKNTKKLKIFDGITDEVVQEIINNSERTSFAAGEIIMEQGDIPDGNGYIIESGEVEVFIHGEMSAHLSAGDIFGEIALLNEEERSATIISKSPVNTIVLNQDTLFSMIEHDDNSINKEIMRRMEANLGAE
ncbi:cyclic nucleotide-binding domain-containing protein [Candidatus Gracilibacteria bacterium]|nr:cyclic nucleotide-binding domain-containing protein [Candidatus Gracilibacteria bacterium]